MSARPDPVDEQGPEALRPPVGTDVINLGRELATGERRGLDWATTIHSHTLTAPGPTGWTS